MFVHFYIINQNHLKKQRYEKIFLKTKIQNFFLIITKNYFFNFFIKLFLFVYQLFSIQ